MAEKESNYTVYKADNGIELKFPVRDENTEPDAEQQLCYQNFINVLAQILVKYTADLKKSDENTHTA